MLAELVAQGRELGLPLGRDALAEVDEDLEGGGAGGVVKLDRQSIDAVHVAGLLDGEGGAEVAVTDVHVERPRLDVEEFAPGGEAAETPLALQRRGAVGDDDVHVAERLQAADEILPA